MSSATLDRAIRAGCEAKNGPCSVPCPHPSVDCHERLFGEGFLAALAEPDEILLHAMTMVPPTWDDTITRAKWAAAIATIKG